MDSIDLPIVGTFLWLAGLCVGSFLNVVVYRLPRDLSVGAPLWSFCPSCHERIAFRDNLPLLSWLILRGRCRHCRAGISNQYPIIEALTGLLFIVVLYLLFSARARDGLSVTRMPGDIPLLLSWLTLVAVMVVCSATDIVSYMIDVRITNLAVALGVFFAGIWPRSIWMSKWSLADGGDIVWLTIGAVTVVWMWITRPRGILPEPDPEPETDPEPEPQPKPEPKSQAAVAEARTSLAEETPAEIPGDLADIGAADPPVRFRWLGVLALLIFAGMAWWLLVASGFWLPRDSMPAVLPVGAALLAVFVAVVLAGGTHREADEEIEHELTCEQGSARWMALGELGQLLLLVAVGVGLALAILWGLPNGSAWSEAMLQASPLKDWAPLTGVAYAAKGALIAAGAGWFLRIGFTLAIGREAFGTGDIYILAAAGATVGWDIAILGLLCAVGLALAGWMLGLLLKQTTIIPFGPWLALGFLLALWINQPAARVLRMYADNLQTTWQQQPGVVYVMGVVMLFGTVMAIGLAKLVRRVLPSEDVEWHEDSEPE
jgi:prepilin signal peptidase PulO-like enzyme (type II secretory pathway)